MQIAHCELEMQCTRFYNYHVTDVETTYQTQTTYNAHD